MILFPGKHKFRRDSEPSRPCVVDYASVSACGPSYVKVLVNNKLVEHVYVGSYSPHTWWGNNPLLGKDEPEPGQEVVIFVGEDAIFRIESNLIHEMG